MDERETTNRLRAAIEATRLAFGLTGDQVRELVRTAGQLGVRGVCVPSVFVSAAAAAVAEIPDWNADLVSVANFPTGDHDLQEVVREARRAAEAGANQVDVVVPGALVSDRRWREVTSFLREVRHAAEAGAAHDVAMKVILECAALDEERIRGAALAGIEAGARWLKTSTGFHPRGGATEEVVRLLRAMAPPSVGIKASGGIRTRADALRMLNAGADRIGTSNEAVILGAGTS